MYRIMVRILTKFNDLGLFSTNNRISSNKEYFHKVGQSLNRESLDISKSTEYNMKGTESLNSSEVNRQNYYARMFR